jgi:hypothetical protein
MTNEVSVSNIDICGFLISRGFEVSRIEQNGRLVFLIFYDPLNKARLAISEYHKDFPIPAKSFASAMKQAKDMIFEQKRQMFSTTGQDNNDSHKPAAR